MRYELLYQPSYAVARVMLDPGDAIRAESGAMICMSPTVELEAKVTGGLGKMFGRMLAGESAFQSTYTATRGAGEVILAPSTPGDIMPLQLTGFPMIVTSGAFLAGDVTLGIETMASLRGFFSGEGLFMMRISGQGLLLLSSFGAIHRVELREGQPYFVDTGHLVAFSDGMPFNLRRASRSLFGAITSGEGVVAELVGPGTVFIQTRTPQGFGSWLSGFLPGR